MHVVFLSRWYPFPADNGAKIRIYNLLRQLSRRHDVTLLTFASESDRVSAETLATLHESCRDVRVFPYREFRPSSIRAAGTLFFQASLSRRNVQRKELADTLDQVLATHHVDGIIASELAMMPYPLRRKAWPSILDELELAVFHHAATTPLRRLSAVRERLMWWKLTRYLRRSLNSFDACTVVSERERSLVATVAPQAPDPYIVPNAVDTNAYHGDFGAPESESIVFSGALTYAPNLEGAQWFLDLVYPRIRKHIPDAHLRITGGTQGVDLDSLPKSTGLEMTGYLPDIRPTIARSMVSVVPLLSGGGTRLKILESMALGTPVVSTRKGAEGLEVRHGENILIADDPAALANAITAVLRDPSLRSRLARSARALVRSRYDWDTIGPKFCEIVEQTVECRTSGPSRWFA